MAPTVIVDTGVLVALLSRRDQHHSWAAEQARQLPLPWATCEAVLSEAWHRVSPSLNARDGLISMIRRGALAFPFAVAPSLARVTDILEKYADLPTSVADATLLLMAEELPGATIWSTDRDFLLYRMKDRRRVKAILPL